MAPPNSIITQLSVVATVLPLYFSSRLLIFFCSGGVFFQSLFRGFFSWLAVIEFEKVRTLVSINREYSGDKETITLLIASCYYDSVLIIK